MMKNPQKRLTKSFYSARIKLKVHIEKNQKACSNFCDKCSPSSKGRF